jgi:hypothetical protein
MPTPNPNSSPRPDPDRQPREPAAGRPTNRGQGGQARRARPGPPGFTFEVQLVDGEEGRRLEQQQTEAILEALRWLAAHPPAAPAASTTTNAGIRTPPDGPGRSGIPGSPDPDDRKDGSRSYPTTVRVQAVGLVGVGQPLGEVARALSVHPAALRRWVWQAWRRWAAAAGLPDDPAPDHEDRPGGPE